MSSTVPAQKRIIEELRRVAPELSNSASADVEAQIEEYGALAAQGEGLYLRESLIRQILSTADYLSGARSEPDPSFVAQTKQRAYEGMPLDCILRVWRICDQHMWEFFRNAIVEQQLPPTVLIELWSKYQIFANATVKASTEAHREVQSDAELSSRMVASTVFEQLLGEIADGDYIQRTLRQLGVMGSIVAVVAAKATGGEHVPARAGVAFVPLLSAITTEAGVRPPWVIRGAHLITVVEVPNALDALRTAINDASAVHLRIGVSEPADAHRSLAPGLRQAEMALTASTTQEPLRQADRLSIFEIAASQLQVVVDDLPLWVRTFLAEDEERGGDWSETVRALSQSGGNVQRAAHALFVHANTIYYRLSAIKDACGVNASDPEILMSARFATLLLQHRDSAP